MIEITNFSKKYRNTTIFTNINILLEDQKTYFVLGKNGSGKTTFLKCLLGLENYSGTISFTPLENNELFPVFDDIPLYPTLSGYDNIKLLAGKVYNEYEVNKLQGLSKNLLRKKVQYYSLGERKKVLMLAAMLKKPHYIILDEIANGLDLDSIEWLITCIKVLKKDSLIIATGHYFEFYEKILDEIIVLKDNKMLKIKHGKEKLYEVYKQYYRNS